MAKQPGRRGNARPQSLRWAAYVLLAGGVLLVIAAMVSTATRLEAAGDGLLLIGVPLLLLGAALMGLDWMGSYTAAAEGSWDHHETASSARAEPRSKVRRGAAGSRKAGFRPRAKRLRLFGPSQPPSDFAPSAPDSLETDLRPDATGWGADVRRSTASGPPTTAARAAAARLEPGRFEPEGAPAGAASSAAGPSPAPAPAPGSASAANPAPAAASARTIRFEPGPDELPAYLSRVDPGPDTVIEEFVGYEGQDRMLAVREAGLPPPRELAWPNPPRQAVDASAQGNEAFLEKLMDDVLSRIGTPQDMALAAPAAALGPEGAPSRAPSAAISAAARAAHQAAAQQAAHPTAHQAAASAGWAGAAPAAAAAPASSPAWSRQTLHQADHWRFAALVEKLYQQAGFATQLQAGQTMRGVVVLWLFSRHRPGMPASVVSCVHGPGDALAAEEITAVADLVKTRGLPRGQLATTAHIDAAGQLLAAEHRVHLMDTDRLLQLITQRSPEQQRALADRLA